LLVVEEGMSIYPMTTYHATLCDMYFLTLLAFH